MAVVQYTFTQTINRTIQNKQYICSENGCCDPTAFTIVVKIADVTTEATIVVGAGVVIQRSHHFVVPLGDSASISMLSYSQSHYDI